MQTFAAANIDHVRIRRRYRDTSNRAGWLILEDWLPGSSIIGRLEYAAIHLRHIKNVWLRRHSHRCSCATAAERPDVEQTKRLQKFLFHLGHCRKRSCKSQQQSEGDER